MDYSEIDNLNIHYTTIAADREASRQGCGTSKTGICGLFLQPRAIEKPSEGTQCARSCSPSLIIVGPHHHHKYIAQVISL